MSENNFVNLQYSILPKYKKIRVEALLQACTGFIKQKYGNKEDIINLKRPLIDERIELSILRMVCNGLNKENILEYI